MNSKFLAIAGIAVIGALVSVGSADTVINAYVQQFGATPHTPISPPGNARNVQIDWSFAPVTPGSNQTDYNIIDDCSITFDQVLPNGTRVICKLSGHDANTTDGFHDVTQSKIVGYGTMVLTTDTQTMDVPVLCDPNLDNPTGNYTLPCDIQWIEDVKVITLGKVTTDVVAGQPPPPPPPPPAEATLAILPGAAASGPNNDYDPDPLTVAPGTVITVNNTDNGIQHTMTSDTAGLFDTGVINGGDSATIIAPTTPGTYTYHCAIHSNMARTLIVS